ELFIGKVLTTPEDFSTGFFGAIAGAAAAAGWDERVLLGAATRVAHGTTVGINALVTGAVAKVALLATVGHGEALRAKGGEGRIVDGAAERGFAGEVLFGQAEGGLVPASEARRFPLVTLQSGPVANVVGSAVAGTRMGYRSLVVADMGGTTLDAALIDDGRVG